jgi:RNA 3'-terminal phosphate cyclase (ATP)
LYTFFLAMVVYAAAPVVVEIAGGTHNPMAPPFEFLTETFMPLLNRMGHRVKLEIKR